jgi:hypothetical protein
MEEIKKLHANIVMKSATQAGRFYFEGECPTGILDLGFTFETIVKEETPTVYNVPASSWLKKNEGNCDILLTKGVSTFSLGRPFLENHYLGFDIQNNRIGIAALKSNNPHSSDNSATIIIIVIVLILVAGLGVGAFIWYKKRNAPDSDAKQVYKQVADKNEDQ